jgi:hypothetical protein
VQSNFAGAGLDGWTKPPGQNPDMWEILKNIQPVSQGTLDRRWGYNLFSAVGGGSRLALYQSDVAGAVSKKILSMSTTGVFALNEDGTSFNPSIFTPSAGANLPQTFTSRNSNYFSDGIAADLQKWNGAATGGLSKWGIIAPATAPTTSASGSGNVTLVIGRQYFYIYKNSTTGHTSDLSPVSLTTGPLTATQVTISGLVASGDPQVTDIIILATADGNDQTTLYNIGSVTNGTTTFVDNQSEPTVLAQNVYQNTDASGFDHGVANNQPPPTPTGFILPHRGRIYILDGPTLYFSKNLDDVTTSTGVITGRWEEAFPGTYQLSITKGAEVGKGLYSDGQVLYIATERGISRLAGSGPADFTEPEVIFDETGLLNPDCWTTVFRGGQLLGAMWVTPDFRIIQSDFSSYQSVGTPVQHILATINPTATANCRVTYVGIAPHDLFIFAFPTGSNTSCDTLLVYEIATQRWFQWVPADQISGLLYNISLAGTPQFLFSTGANVYQFGPANLQDRVGNTPVDIPYQMRSSWFSGGDPALRTALNEIEIQTDDPNMAVLVTAATTSADFQAPIGVSNRPLTPAPWGALKCHLAGEITRDRFYRLDLSNTSGQAQTLLRYLAIEVKPINRF